MFFIFCRWEVCRLLMLCLAASLLVSCSSPTPQVDIAVQTSSTTDSCPHTLTPADCPFCRPELIETGGMCGGHDVPEALCSRCNDLLIPAFKALKDWCGEHNLPESQCLLCNPELANTKTSALDPEITASSADPETFFPRTKSPPSLTCNTLSQDVYFATDGIADAIGLTFTTLAHQRVSGNLVANAELTYREDRLAHLAPRSPATLVRLTVALGDKVTAGSVIALAECPELATLQADYLQAESQFNLLTQKITGERSLLEQGIISKRDFFELETDLEHHRIDRDRTLQHLRAYDLTPAEITALRTNSSSSGILKIRAPFAGRIVAVSAVSGEPIGPQTPILTLADTTQMWARIDVFENEQSLIRIGQNVVFQSPGLRGQTFAGTVTWINPELNSATRTLEVRASFDNPDQGLRAGMFGKATIELSQGERALVLPKQAVQWEGCCNVAFVRKSNLQYEPRKLKLGLETEAGFVIESGLAEGEQVVTTGSFLLKTEILKGQIGAGCCAVEAKN